MSEPKSHARRDALIALEAAAQQKWEAERVFEADAPAEYDASARNKFMATFPYPYMNGRLHVGHIFTLSKAEFKCAYERLRGRHVLFPFAFHVTGMPIKACADKLKREIEVYGNPPIFPEQPEAEAESTGTNAGEKADPTRYGAKKTKAAQKAGVGSQWSIMRMLGVPEDMIADFADSLTWLKYFPPLAVQDLKRFGLSVDWRRAFITTDVNPYYDSFVRWQFETLRAKNKVLFGKRYAIYSPLDGQTCADHDRASGEGVQSQEYTCVKLKCLEPMNPKLTEIVSGAGQDRPCFYACATLRPETMYGQTNCWVLPSGEYGVFIRKTGEADDAPTELIVCAPRAALNMSYQGIMDGGPGKPTCVGLITGQDLIGQPTSAPNCVAHDRIYTLPLLTISMNKGTGVVTSVVSDAPDDYAALRDLQLKPALREKYHVKDEWCVPFDPIPIINVPGFGELSAIKVYGDMKIKSQNDRELLRQAKEMVYLKGFYEGRLIVGPHAGMKVQEAKTVIRDEMIAKELAFAYAEPESRVIARSGCECVVAKTDQWYIAYGEEDWKAAVSRHLEQMDTYGEETRRQLRAALGWLHEWACSRSFGLGTKLPWDPQYVIESLSDSTIYMAFYTISHFLQGGTDNVDGSHPGPLGISPEQMTAEVWDHVLLDKPLADGDTDIPRESLDLMRREFDFWYPQDVRVSGKDLIQNHLVFALYNHAAIFEGKRWPAGMRTNGHLMLNSEKMSKSTGNFLSLFEALDKYGSDATRLAMADAGDGMDDANFAEDTANAAILRLTTQLEWTRAMLASPATGVDTAVSTAAAAAASQAGALGGSSAIESEARGLRAHTEPHQFVDRWFATAMDLAIANADEAYDRMNFREALLSGFYSLQDARDQYRQLCASRGMHGGLIRRFIDVQTVLITPLCPHFAERCRELAGHAGLAVTAHWPRRDEVDLTLLRAGQFVQDAAADARTKLAGQGSGKKGKKGKKAAPAVPPTHATFYVAEHYPEWQAVTLDIIRNAYDADQKTVRKGDVMAVVKANAQLKPMMKKVMPFVAFVSDDAAKRGDAALELSVPFDQLAALRECTDCLSQSVGGLSVDVQRADVKCDSPAAQRMCDLAVPGKCSVYLFAQSPQ